MNSKTKDIILYDNYYSSEKEEYAKENLLANNPELYKSIQDIPAKDSEDALYWLDMQDWEDIKFELTTLFKQDDYLLTGYFGNWKGNLVGGKFIRNFKDLQSVLSHLDSIRILDRNRLLIIEGLHHDSYDRYELKRLPKKPLLLPTATTLRTTVSFTLPFYKTTFTLHFPTLPKRSTVYDCLQTLLQKTAQVEALPYY